jgi:excisionase family DNA binding protein
MSDGLALQLDLPPAVLDRLADMVAERVAARLASSTAGDDRWMSTAEAAEYLGMSTNALHRLTSERKVPFSQDRPGGKCWFKRSDLDAWRSR